MLKNIIFLIIATLLSSCSNYQLSKTGRPIISIKESDLAKNKNDKNACIDDVFTTGSTIHRDTKNFGDQYRIRYYRKARDKSKKVLMVSRIASFKRNQPTQSAVLPIKKSGIYEITQLDMMFLRTDYRLTALLYIVEINSNGEVLRNVEATSMGSVSSDLYNQLAKVRRCLK